MVNTIDEMAPRHPEVFDAAIAEVPDSMVTEQLLTMPSRIRTFAEGFVHRVHAEDLSLHALPRSEGHTAVSQSPARIWKQGEWRNGRWVTGRYLGRVTR